LKYDEEIQLKYKNKLMTEILTNITDFSNEIFTRFSQIESNSSNEEKNKILQILDVLKYEREDIYNFIKKLQNIDINTINLIIK
jgi:hypothetical protein